MVRNARGRRVVNTSMVHPDTPPAQEASTADPPLAPAAPDREIVREQLGRVVSSTLFRNSRRFPAFLRYTVEHALSSTEPLKERTIGHEVFGRDPGYDTAQDPVVRMTAAEVRKRLAQYYQLPEHAAEPVINFAPGSYVPEFILRHRPPVIDDSPAPPDAHIGPRKRLAPPWLAAVTVGASLIALIAWWAWPRPVRANAADRVWAPITSSAGPVLICIGDPTRVQTEASGEPTTPDPAGLSVSEFLRQNAVRYTDAVTLSLLAGELRARDTPFRIRRPAATELKDLREGPVVLIGGLNNPWALRLSEGLRFTLAVDDNGSFIRDRDRPADRQWRMGDGRTTALKDIGETYGLITRVQDPATGHSVMTVSGLALGTRAAGECLIDGACLESAERLGGGSLGAANLQIVVSAAVIGEDSGAPRVVAFHSW